MIPLSSHLSVVTMTQRYLETVLREIETDIEAAKAAVDAALEAVLVSRIEELYDKDTLAERLFDSSGDFDYELELFTIAELNSALASDIPILSIDYVERYCDTLNDECDSSVTFSIRDNKLFATWTLPE